MSKRKPERSKPYCFISYSTREPHVKLLIECLRIVFTTHFEVKLTPSGLESGASQRDQITSLIEGCAFAVVALDGLRGSALRHYRLRPNVVFEYGILHAKKRPTMLFKEAAAEVDIRSFLGDRAGPGIPAVPLEIDSQFSDVKDVNYATWNRFEIATTARLIWDEYRKKEKEIQGYVKIPEPNLCT